MSARLIDVLARAGAEQLNALLGASTVALMRRIAPGAGNQRGLAELVVSQYTPAGSLRTPTVRQVVLHQLNRDEAEELCKLLTFPTGDPSNTLKQVAFDVDTTSAEILRAYFLIDYDDTRIPAPLESSRRLTPSHTLKRHQIDGFRVLRRRIADRNARVLVHMPSGAGKLRLVATALVDLYRSEADGHLIVWLASGERFCEDAFEELAERWREIGSRDVTAFKLYGEGALPNLANLHEGIVVADIGKLSEKYTDHSDELRALGGRTRVVVLSDATHVVDFGYSAPLSRMAEGGSFSLVGLCAAPTGLLQTIGIAEAMGRAYDAPHVIINESDPQRLLLEAGDVVDVNVVTFVRIAETMAPAGTRDVADAEAERDAQLIQRLITETTAGGKVVFFADSAEQARMFVGILALKAARAMVVSGTMPAEQRSQEIARFNSRVDVRILCVHDALVAGSEATNATTALIASRKLSVAVYVQMIGRLASGRGVDAEALKVVAMDGDIVPLNEVMFHLNDWKNMETGR